MGRLQQRTISGVVCARIQRFGSMAITLVTNVILARLLSPNEFGCIGMLMIFISISNTFIDGGLGSALIQKKSPTDEDYSTVFYWNIALSIFLYVVLYTSANHIATFYRTPLLKEVLRWQGIVLLFNALNVIQLNQLRKQLQFKKLALVEISSACLSLFIAIIFALRGYGVWSLVIQQISISIIKTFLLWFVSSWRPILAFSTKSFKDLFKFGSFILLSNLFSTFSNEIQGLLVGRMCTSASLGLYNQAFRLEGSIATAVSGIIDQVTYPVMSSIQDQRERLIFLLKKFVQIPAYICAPIMGLLIVIAKPIILFIYGVNWLDCVPYFQILCSAGLAVCLQGSANNSIAAVGKSKMFFKWTIIKRSITILLCVLGILIGGMYGLLWACSIGAWSVYFINAYLVDRCIGYRVFNQVMDILPFVCLTIAVSIISWYIGRVMPFGIIINTFMQIILHFSLYFACSSFLKYDAFIFIKNILLVKLCRK